MYETVRVSNYLELKFFPLGLSRVLRPKLKIGCFTGTNGKVAEKAEFDYYTS